MWLAILLFFDFEIMQNAQLWERKSYNVLVFDSLKPLTGHHLGNAQNKGIIAILVI